MSFYRYFFDDSYRAVRKSNLKAFTRDNGLFDTLSLYMNDFMKNRDIVQLLLLTYMDVPCLLSSTCRVGIIIIIINHHINVDLGNQVPCINYLVFTQHKEQPWTSGAEYWATWRPTKCIHQTMQFSYHQANPTLWLHTVRIYLMAVNALQWEDVAVNSRLSRSRNSRLGSLRLQSWHHRRWESLSLHRRFHNLPGADVIHCNIQWVIHVHRLLKTT